MMDNSIAKHHGELSLLEMMQNIKSSPAADGRSTPETSSATAVIIALNEEKNRRLVANNILILTVK